jgi:hypothetical protein
VTNRFSENRDGFELKTARYELPDNFGNLNAEGKRAAAICNLFVNQGFTVHMIKLLLDEDYQSIVKILIAHQVVKDRRTVYRKPPSNQERRSDLPR